MFDVAIENAFNFLSREYSEFFRASIASAFQHPVWLTHFYGTLLETNGATPLILVVRNREDGELAMVLPLVRKRYGVVRTIEFADLGVSDYASPVVSAATFAQILADPAARVAIRAKLKPFDLLRIRKLQDGGLPLHELLGAPPLASMGMSAYAAPLCDSYDGWRAQNLNPSYRKELDKKARQLERKGVVRFECAADPVAIRAVFDRMREYRRIRFDGKDGTELLQLDAYFDFYLKVATSGIAGLARTYALYVDDEPIACVFGLELNRRYLVLLSGFDHARFKNQSIGALMFERVAADCIAKADTVLDFTIGDEAYKTTFGARPSSMWTMALPGSAIGWLANIFVVRVPMAKAIMRRLSQGRVEARSPELHPARGPADVNAS